MTLITLKNNQLVVKISTLGAELQSVVDQSNQERIWQAQADVWPRHAPVLFPIVGRLRDNHYRLNKQVYELGQHGFARDCEFEVVNQQDSYVTLKLQADREIQTVYPFLFTLEITFILHDNDLQVNYSIQNHGQELMPFAIGGHPGFVFDYQQPQAQLIIENPQQVQRLQFTDNNLIDQTQLQAVSTREIALNSESFDHDAWVYQSHGMNSYSIGTPDHYQIKMTTNSPYFGVWSAYPKKGKFICLEPWWGLADTEDSDGQIFHKFGINQLQPQQLFNASWQVTFN